LSYYYFNPYSGRNKDISFIHDDFAWSIGTSIRLFIIKLKEGKELNNLSIEYTYEYFFDRYPIDIYIFSLLFLDYEGDLPPIFRTRS